MANALYPFRIHFHDPDLSPIDIDAADAKAARDIAAERRRVPVAAIRKVKVIRENADV
ncbi:hypothetical protein [Sinorhizobium sp. NFACC03]|uniref:hypothetical protein n=1 Tax=Sinorhizobium sp. NFACC03 TaxID=1566295 RepID=UPI000882BEAA|nr:hypothetical protein [Sinorhizobium sp. NFACC03]SDA39140.1 hypothetical protein SAMN03159448_00157 [Sinorhizobium sp. NFACC03]